MLHNNYTKGCAEKKSLFFSTFLKSKQNTLPVLPFVKMMNSHLYNRHVDETPFPEKEKTKKKTTTHDLNIVNNVQH